MTRIGRTFTRKGSVPMQQKGGGGVVNGWLEGLDWIAPFGRVGEGRQGSGGWERGLGVLSCLGLCTRTKLQGLDALTL